MAKSSQRPPRTMQPYERTLCITAGLLGVAVFIASLQRGGAWIYVGIGALLVGLIAASFVAYRGRWR